MSVVPWFPCSNDSGGSIIEQAVTWDGPASGACQKCFSLYAGGSVVCVSVPKVYGLFCGKSSNPMSWFDVASSGSLTITK